jgi:hypothetical protein
MRMNLKSLLLVASPFEHSHAKALWQESRAPSFLRFV